jgi:molybdopterin biosynthesis enzyme
LLIFEDAFPSLPSLQSTLDSENLLSAISESEFSSFSPLISLGGTSFGEDDFFSAAGAVAPTVALD